MYQSESAPWLWFRAWNTDGSAKTDLVFNTSGIDVKVARDNLANSSSLSLSAASSPTDWAAGKLSPIVGNLYRVGISTALISSYTGNIAVCGSYTGGVLEGIIDSVSAYDPTKNPLSPSVAGRQIAISATTGRVTAEAVELDSSSVTAVQSGLATAAAVQSVKDDTGTTLPAQSTAIYNRLGVPAGASMSADVAAVKADTASLLTRLTANAATAIQNLFHMITGSGSGSKFTTAALENGSAAGGASLEDIIAGVQSVSGGIIAAQDESALYITIGDTWTQDIESLGNLTNKTVSFAIKSKAKDADAAAVVMIVEGTGLTRLNGAATTAGWGSIEILDETAGDIRLRLESDATSLLTSGTYVDAVKALEDGDDRTLRQKGRTVVSAGVIADIT